jgi:hypothetical protein
MLFTSFRTKCCVIVLIMSREGRGQAGEEHEDEKDRDHCLS